MGALQQKQRLPLIVDMIGRGFNGSEIANHLQISIRTYFADCKKIKEEMSEDGKVNEACVRILALKNDAVRKAQLRYKDCKKEHNKNDAVRLVMQTTESLEKTKARLGLIPNESQNVEFKGDVSFPVLEGKLDRIIAGVSKKLKEKK